jgi:hypothetical protein
MSEIPQRGGVTWWGNPLKDRRVMLQTHPETTMAEMTAELLWAQAQMKGLPPTPELAEVVWAKAQKMELRDLLATRARGVARDLRKLVGAERKKLALRIAKAMVVTKQDFYDLTVNCGALNLSHHSKHLEFVPEQRRLTAADNNAIFNLDGSRTPETLMNATSRVKRVFSEREHRSVHLFADSRERWHCFFLTFQDIAGEPFTGKHHWEQGSHLHYMSHLFDPKITRHMVWEALDERRHSLPTAHVRFDDEPVPRDPGGRFVLDEQLGRATKVKT